MSTSGLIVSRQGLVLAEGSQALSDGPFLRGSVASALELLIQPRVVGLAGGTRFEFPHGDGDPAAEAGSPPSPTHPLVHQLPLSIPHCSGMDELEIQGASFQVAEERVPWSFAASGGRVSAVTVDPTREAARPGLLQTVKVLNFRPQLTSEFAIMPLVLFGPSELGPQHQYTLFGPGGEVTSRKSDATGLFVHGLVQAKSSSGFGPPIAAAPYFAMPDNQANLYGPALGGMSARVVRGRSGLDLVFSLSPLLELGAFRFSLGIGGEGRHSGLPHEVRLLTWECDGVEAIWQRQPGALSVYLTTNVVGEAPVIAEFAQPTGDQIAEVDFTPAARAVVRSSYPLQNGPSLDLQLRFQAASAGAIRVLPSTIRARYVRHLIDEKGRAVRVRGDSTPLELGGVPRGSRPRALSFTVEGSYGAALLTAHSDAPARPSPRRGHFVSGTTRVARRTTLTADEREQQLLRVSVLGRASEPTELLISLHESRGGGPPGTSGAGLLGIQRGVPVSLLVDRSSEVAWRRAQVPLALGLGPHPEALLVVVQCPRGGFWWYGDHQESTEVLRSEDAGATWSPLGAALGLQLHVESLDPVVRTPIPDRPLVVHGLGTLRLDDLAQFPLLGPPGEFRRHFISDDPTGVNEALSVLAELPRDELSMHFECERDVDLNVTDFHLVYDPWKAR